MSSPNGRRLGRLDKIAVLDIETIAPPVAENAFPPWPVHEPVVASILTATGERYGQWHFTLESVDFLAGATGFGSCLITNW